MVGADAVPKKLGNSFVNGMRSLSIGTYAEASSNTISNTFTIPSNCEGDALLIFNQYESYNDLAGACTSISISGTGVKNASIKYNPRGMNKTPSIFLLSCVAGGTINISMKFQKSVSHYYLYGAGALFLY